MFRKILIANRGEIACRIARTARRMGIATVAVYSDADRDGLHVAAADEAVRIGPPAAAESYLDIERILAACRETGADAVHPGYGFLSERAAFAEAVTGARLTFIGPNARAIELMGDKIRSKEIAAKAGVPVVPGHVEVLKSEADARKVAKAVGFPVMIKAAGGGGGKGMRVARTPEEAAEGFRLARSEAQSAFGDGRVFIEALIEHPRHIEVQVVGDRHGHLVHLGERECSIQRRNQKVLEEAPSPFLDARQRAALGAQAVALAKAVGYDSAGTVEFIAARDGRLFFLEMNTRLQVEHGVTELVTGLDLVEQMIRVAAGEKLGFAQRDVRLDGWAVEARVYAEDPRRGFLPSVGRLSRLRMPAEGESGEGTLRIDSGVAEGSEVTVYYDPMIAKVMAHGPTRSAATETLAAALDRVVIDGVGNNVGFLSALLAHPRWESGDLSVDLIAAEFPKGGPEGLPAAVDLHRLAAVALSMELARRDRLERLPGRAVAGTAWQSDWVVSLDRRQVALGCPGGMAGSPIEIDVVFRGDGRPAPVTTRWTPGDPVWSGAVDGEPLAVQVRPGVGSVRLAWRGYEMTARVMTPEVAALDAVMPVKMARNGRNRVLCPMPGTLLSIAVAEGQAVKSGDALAVVEAMKMENVLRAERDGTIKRIAARAGDALAVDALILEFA